MTTPNAAILSGAEKRQQFERWISSPPFEKSIRRHPNNEDKYAWPGQYSDYDTQLAWEGYRAGFAAGAASVRAVPREPTQEMCAAATEYADTLEEHAIMTYANIWRAMYDAALSAAPTGEKP